MKKLFYISSMKGINNKIKILCGTTTSKKLYHCHPELSKEDNDFLPAKEITTFRGTIQGYTLSWRMRGLITSRLIIITDIITCWLFQILHTTTGQWLKIVTIKRQGVSSRASLFNKVINQVNDCVINWLSNQDIVL